MENMQKYQQVFMEIFGVDAGVLNEEFTFSNVGMWDSMTHLTLITELEDSFGVMFESEDIIHYGSYLNGIDILKKYGVTF